MAGQAVVVAEVVERVGLVAPQGWVEAVTAWAAAVMWQGRGW